MNDKPRYYSRHTIKIYSTNIHLIANKNNLKRNRSLLVNLSQIMFLILSGVITTLQLYQL